MFLPIDGAIDRIDDAGELDQQAIAHQLDDAPAVALDHGPQDLLAQVPDAAQCAGLVLPHQAGISDHIGGQDRGESALHQGLPPAAA